MDKMIQVSSRFPPLRSAYALDAHIRLPTSDRTRVSHWRPEQRRRGHHYKRWSDDHVTLASVSPDSENAGGALEIAGH